MTLTLVGSCGSTERNGEVHARPLSRNQFAKLLPHEAGEPYGIRAAPKPCCPLKLHSTFEICLGADPDDECGADRVDRTPGPRVANSADGGVAKKALEPQASGRPLPSRSASKMAGSSVRCRVLLLRDLAR